MIDTSMEMYRSASDSIPPMPQLISSQPSSTCGSPLLGGATTHRTCQATTETRDERMSSSEEDEDDMVEEEDSSAFAPAHQGNLAYLRNVSVTNSPNSFQSRAMSDSCCSSELDGAHSGELAASPSLSTASDSRKPKVSFIAMITMAIRSTPKQKATLAQIYDYIRQNFPFYDADGSNWQNSIRHNLSLNACFTREARKSDDPGKGSYWMIDQQYGDMFRNGYNERRKKRVKKVPLRPRPPRRRQSFGPSPVSHMSSPSTPPTPPITPEVARRSAHPAPHAMVQRFQYPTVTSTNYSTVIPTQPMPATAASPYSVTSLLASNVTSAQSLVATAAEAPATTQPAYCQYVQVPPGAILVRPPQQATMPIVFVQRPQYVQQAQGMVQYTHASPAEVHSPVMQ